MLKFIYKFFLISLLSGCLLLLDFSVKGVAIQALRAADETVDANAAVNLNATVNTGIVDASVSADVSASAATTATPASTSSGTSSSASDQLTFAPSTSSASSTAAKAKAEAGASAQTAELQKEMLKTGGGKDSDMMATLTMIVVGLVASRLFSCKMTADMMAAAAGGVLFIASEIMGNSAIKQAMKQMETEITRDKQGNIDQAQVETLQKLKKSYETAKKSANTKKMMQMAAAAAFLVAAGIAVAKYMSERTTLATCVTSIQTNIAACNAAAASCATNGATCVYPGGAAQAAAVLTSITGADVAASTPGPSLPVSTATTAATAANQASLTAAAAICPLLAPSVAACATITPVNVVTKSFCPIPPAVVSKPSTALKALYAAQIPVKPTGIMGFVEKYLISSAHSFSMIGIASTAAVIFIVAMSKTLGTMVDQFLHSPMNRAIIWGVLAGLCFMASTATGNVIKKLDGYIKQIDEILKGVKANSNGIATGTVTNPKATAVASLNPSIKDTTIDGQNYDGIDLSAGGGVSIPCFTGPSNTNCQSFEDAIKNVGGISNLSIDTQKQLSSLMKTASGFNGASQISSASLAGAATLAASANALKSNLDRLTKGLNDRIKLSGKTYEGESKKFTDQLDRAVRNGLKKSNSSAGGMLASIGGYGSGAGKSSISDAVAAIKPEETLKKEVAAPANVVNMGASSFPTIDGGMGAGFDGSGKGAAAAMSEAERKALEAQEAANAANGMDQYELGNDITKDANSSIFELISHRYKTSGYQRLFKLKETK